MCKWSIFSIKKVNNKFTQEEAEKDLVYLLTHLRGIALKLLPIMPETAEKILNLIKENKVPEAPLFLRKE